MPMRRTVAEGPGRAQRVERDRELVGECMEKGSAEALSTLLESYRRSLTAYFGQRAGYSNAEDLTQETLISAWESLERFDRSKNFQAWIFGIAAHKLVDHHRAREIRDAAGLNVLRLRKAEPALRDDPADIMAAREEKDRLARRLQQLHINQRIVLERRYIDGASDAAVREELGITSEQLSSLLWRGKQALRKVLERGVCGAHANRQSTVATPT